MVRNITGTGYAHVSSTSPSTTTTLTFTALILSYVLIVLRILAPNIIFRLL